MPKAFNFFQANSQGVFLTNPDTYFDWHMQDAHHFDVLCIREAKPASHCLVKVGKYFAVPSHVSGKDEVNDSLQAEGVT